MKITKFVHSCVVVETEDRSALFDPGTFSWQSGLIDIEKLPKLDDIVISHEHSDHFNEEFVTELIKRFPDVSWITNIDIAKKLNDMGAKNVTSESTAFCNVLDIPHEQVEPFGVMVKHIGVDWQGVITYTGDTFNIEKTNDILFIPVEAPWGTLVDGMKKIFELKPKYVLPMHDYLLRDEWKEIVYKRVGVACAEKDITFLKPINGKTLEIEL